ncbi:MAG: TraE/TraK family type IV conjugative transfer system protein [Chlamydiota bacterium]
MKKEIAKSAQAFLVLQRNLFLFIAVVFFFSTIALSIVALKKETITLFEKPKQKIDAHSIEQKAAYVAHLVLQRSPATWMAQDRVLLEEAAPSFLSPFRTFLKQAYEQMKKEQKSFDWVLKDTAIDLSDPLHPKVFLEGNLKAYIPSHNGEKQLVEEHSKSYLVEFVVENGKCLLAGFSKREK